eukprot:CAMPEP_0183476814 /NCGR_PEP_ID=MMETSP0370-20130417/167072_1 /TAXON_ID=268820 /ORGANISM="Peridinium aciculiferum, Strain PAER-2" /LENGTH=117 /DNA_ID=CAMNT_0025669685 /DNA_START=146 /DNA_END=496 /DNA_ORIENTATION=-
MPPRRLAKMAGNSLLSEGKHELLPVMVHGRLRDDSVAVKIGYADAKVVLRCAPRAPFAGPNVDAPAATTAPLSGATAAIVVAVGAQVADLSGLGGAEARCSEDHWCRLQARRCARLP